MEWMILKDNGLLKEELNKKKRKKEVEITKTEGLVSK